MSSYTRDKEESTLEISDYQQCHGLKEILKYEFLRLVRIRDFISLMLMYPRTMPDQHLLRKWRDDAQVLTAIYSQHIDSGGVKVSRAFRWMHLLSEKPLKNMEVLLPNDILSQIDDGKRLIFNGDTAILLGEVVASANTSKMKEVLDLANVHNIIPKAILNLAADLAVDQLIQTLLTCNIHHVMFSTRNGVEKKDVMRKIEAALSDGHSGTVISKKYSRVLWVDASKYSSNTEFWVQQEIALQLNLMTREADQTENNDISLPRLIEAEMMRMNHLVFLVDGDGDRKLDPRKVGFPKKRLASIVVFLTVESSMEECDELTMAVDLEIRTEDHILPWELFCRNVGRELLSLSSDIQRIAVQIVEECHGHLLAIVLVARYLMNNEDVEFWKLALNKLRHLPPIRANIIHGDRNKVMVNAFVNIIWNSLNETEKLCLACSLYVLRLEESMADHLLISSWVYNELVHSREEGECILKNFVHRCILLQSERKYIRWFEEIYDVLKSSFLEFPPLNTIKKGGLGLTELPTAKEWLSAKNIELMDNKLSELPPSPTWPQVTQLLLHGNASLMEIPPLFFHLMPHLCILDLSYTSIRSLPSSFFNLKELRQLRLRGCKRYMELPPEIGQVKNLEILDLDSTPITYVPKQIQELTRLRKLIISFYTCHDTMKSLRYLVPPGVISKLSHLHHLSIDVNPLNKLWDENIQVILQDISELQELDSLSLYIPQVELLNDVPKHLDFKYTIGHHIQQRIISHVPLGVEAIFKQHSCSLKFVNDVNISNDTFRNLWRCEALFLERQRTIWNFSQINRGNLLWLQSFIVGECDETETLIDEQQNIQWIFLCIFCMNNLRSICEAKAYFYKLKTIALHNCPKLTIIFTLNFLDSLMNLEELVVEDCPKISTLVSLGPFESKEGIFLPSLRKVSLLYLPELVSISSGLCIGPRLERIVIYDCPKLQILSTAELVSSYLKVINGEKEWWDTLKWEEVEWGKEGRPDYLHMKFSPINEEIDIFDQLQDEESSGSNIKEVWVENLVAEANNLFTPNNEADESFKETSVYLKSKATLVRDQNESNEDKSSRSNKEEISVEDLVAEADILFTPNDEADEFSKETSVENLVEADILFTPNDEADESSKETSVYLKSKATPVRDEDQLDEDESPRSNEKKIPDSFWRDLNESSKSKEKETKALPPRKKKWLSLFSRGDSAQPRQKAKEKMFSIFSGMAVSLGTRIKAASPLNTGVNSKYVSTDGNDVSSTGSKVSVASVPRTPRSEGEILQSSNLKIFTLAELKVATRNFRPDSVLGEGGFGSVFKGWIDEHSLAPTKPGTGIVIAVKRLNQDGFQGHKEWLAEVMYLGQLSHPHLVKLVGFCLEDEHRLLVYEFMPRGSLENHLFRRSSYFQPLSWSLRMNVALGAAKGLAFLHGAETQVIHRNFNTSNVLLDSNYNAKLSDFRLARDGPTGDKSHVSTRVMGTYGYAAPEYLATGHLTAKSDVYSFGVVLLEILCGRRAIDRNRPSREHNLVEWANPYLANKRKIFRVMDSRLEGQYSIKEAHKAAILALRCLSVDSKKRPNMDEVVTALEQLQVPVNEKGKPCELLGESVSCSEKKPR